MLLMDVYFWKTPARISPPAENLVNQGDKVTIGGVTSSLSERHR
jgi:hypothetical protein